MREIELKPCQFCGGKATLINQEFFGCNGVVVICSNCRAKSRNFTGAYMEDQAAEAWNRRVDK